MRDTLHYTLRCGESLSYSMSFVHARTIMPAYKKFVSHILASTGMLPYEDETVKIKLYQSLPFSKCSQLLVEIVNRSDQIRKSCRKL